jgi:hypothetical protein
MHIDHVDEYAHGRWDMGKELLGEALQYLSDQANAR